MRPEMLSATESLNTLRRRLGLGQEQVARVLGLTVLAVDRIERGYLAPPQRLHEALRGLDQRLARNA